MTDKSMIQQPEDAVDLQQPYTRLACYRCKEMQVSRCERYCWCVLHKQEFPLMCEAYHG